MSEVGTVGAAVRITHATAPEPRKTAHEESPSARIDISTAALRLIKSVTSDPAVGKAINQVSA